MKWTLNLFGATVSFEHVLAPEDLAIRANEQQIRINKINGEGGGGEAGEHVPELHVREACSYFHPGTCTTRSQWVAGWRYRIRHDPVGHGKRDCGADRRGVLPVLAR